MTEDEMVEWHHQLYGHESEQTLEDSEGQESLVRGSPWGHKESDKADQLNKLFRASPHTIKNKITFSLIISGAERMHTTHWPSLSAVALLPSFFLVFTYFL